MQGEPAILVHLAELWPYIAGTLTVLLSIITSAHIVLTKSDSRSAVGWVGLVWLAPVVGAVLYVMFGINRIRRRGHERTAQRLVAPTAITRPEEFRLPAERAHLLPLTHLVDKVSGRALTSGNTIHPLEGGDAAYPEMVAAIDAAEHTVGLATYIFDSKRAGTMFLDALERAVARGVEVRVLVDAVGARYSWPPIIRALRRRKVPVARFERTFLPWRMPYMNLRNHRKILVVDGRIGFAGGMNIREGSLLSTNPRKPVLDLHFRVEGPVVAQLVATFLDDWEFTTHETLDGPGWYPRLEKVGDVIARGIADGPDLNFDKARYCLLGALACAQSSVRVVTPYFVPDARLITAMNVTAMRGVKVEIILPEKSNLALVQWASTAQLWQLLRRECRVFYSPPPFDHTKLMVVDGAWAFIGSTNWDARSLRLNYEFDIECYGEQLVAELTRLVDARLEAAREVTLADMDRRSLPIKLRDGVARLAAPYL